MDLKLIKKSILKIDEFQFKCSIGTKGIKKNKNEGDSCTPIGKYKLKKTYWYLMTTTYNGNLEPQFDEGIVKAEWKNKEEIPDLMENAYQNIKILLEEVDLI